MKNLQIFESFINEDSTAKALLVFVYKHGNQDTTNGGITSTVDQIRLVGKGVEGPFKIKEGEDYLVLMEKHVSNKPYIYAVPNSLINSSPMFGGNFVYSSDSRFPSKYPIPVHDRVESEEFQKSMD